jgi:hypothetical protein
LVSAHEGEEGNMNIYVNEIVATLKALVSVKG